MNYFKNKKGAPEILSNYSKNQAQVIPETPKVKNGPRDSFKPFQKTPRFFYNGSKTTFSNYFKNKATFSQDSFKLSASETRPKKSPIFFQTTKKLNKIGARDSLKYFKNKIQVIPDILSECLKPTIQQYTERWARLLQK